MSGAATRPDPSERARKRAAAGKTARPIIRWLRHARRFSQLAFFVLFCWLLAHTAFRGSFAAETGPVRIGMPVEGFLLADPFVALTTLLSTHTVYRDLVWAFGVVVLTVLFGKAFCGWVCPFGTLHHFFAWVLPSRKLMGSRRSEQNKTRPVRQRAKYHLLYALMAAAACGSAVGGLFDPICLAVRSIGLAVLPAAQYVTGAAAGWLRTTNLRPFQSAADLGTDALAAQLWQSRQLHYHQSWLIGVLLVALLFMNRVVPRFWCRVLCPLGALLGLLSRRALLGMHKEHARCNDCGLCLRDCQGADSPQGGAEWRQDECHVCLNCEVACPEHVIEFRWLPSRKRAAAEPDAGRRTALASLAAGAVAVPVLRAADSLDVNHHARLIRPPGSLPERDLLERCVRCGECMKVCPNNALHPAWHEGGIEGLWTPVLIPRIGYCELDCVLCSEVCPTGAIRKITEDDRRGAGDRPIVIGTAFYDHGRCLPWAMATPCIVCEEFCPTSPKAIWVEQVEVSVRAPRATAAGGEAATTVKLQRPYVDIDRCVGCGACEHACVVQAEPAIYVTSAGESRSRSNVLVLGRGSRRAP
jgi:polyferredoxin